MRPTWILLDRDGTINVKAAEGHYISEPDQVRLLPGAGEAMRMLNEAGLPAVVVTNQRGVALGRMMREDVDAVNRRVSGLVAEAGGKIDGYFVCPHDSGCACRKPLPGLLSDAAETTGRSLLEAVLIGDSESDVLAARAASVPAILLNADRAVYSRAACVLPCLLDAVTHILAVGGSTAVDGSLPTTWRLG